MKAGDKILFEVFRLRGQDRRQGIPHHARGRHPRHSRLREDRHPCRSSSSSTRRPRSAAQGRHHHGRGRQGDAGPAGRNVVLDKKFGAPTITKDGVTVAKEIEPEGPKYENMGAQMVREVARRPPTSPVTAPPPRPCWPRRSSTKGLKNVTAGANRRPEAGHRGRRRGGRGGSQEQVSKSPRPRGDRPGRHDRLQQRQPRRQADRRGDGEGRQGRRHHGRGRQVGRDRAGRGRGHAVRSRLLSPVLRDGRRADGSTWRTPTSSSTRRRSAA